MAPCTMNEALASPGWTLEVKKITCFCFLLPVDSFFSVGSAAAAAVSVAPAFFAPSLPSAVTVWLEPPWAELWLLP